MAMDTLNAQKGKVAWELGAAQRDQLSKRATTPALIRLYQLLLFTMPGTPVFNYGDEIGLQAVVSYTNREDVQMFQRAYSCYRV